MKGNDGHVRLVRAVINLEGFIATVYVGVQLLFPFCSGSRAS